jgi:hypothetical protein
MADTEAESMRPSTELASEAAPEQTAMVTAEAWWFTTKDILAVLPSSVSVAARKRIAAAAAAVRPTVPVGHWLNLEQHAAAVCPELSREDLEVIAAGCVWHWLLAADGVRSAEPMRSGRRARTTDQREEVKDEVIANPV